MKPRPTITIALVAILAVTALGTAWFFRPRTVAPVVAVSPAPALVHTPVFTPATPVVVSGEPRAIAAPATSSRQALFDKALPFDARLRAIQALGSGLNAGERDLLLGYLGEAKPADGLSDDQRNALKNDMLNVLRQQNPPVKDLARKLAAMSQDAGQSPIMRDYALQHLSEYRTKAVKADPAQAKMIDQVFWDAASQRKETSAGTALLALTRLVESEPEDAQRRKRLEQAALALARDESAPAGPRITALSVAGRLGSEGAFDLAIANLDAGKTGALQFVSLNTLRVLNTRGMRLSHEQKEALSRVAAKHEASLQNNFENLLSN